MSRGPSTLEAAARFKAYCLHLFEGDAPAQAEIREAFRVMMHPAGPACTNELDSFMGMCREALAMWLPVVNRAGRPQ